MYKDDGKQRSALRVRTLVKRPPYFFSSPNIPPSCPTSPLQSSSSSQENRLFIIIIFFFVKVSTGKGSWGSESICSRAWWKLSETLGVMLLKWLVFSPAPFSDQDTETCWFGIDDWSLFHSARLHEGRNSSVMTGVRPKPVLKWIKYEQFGLILKII